MLAGTKKYLAFATIILHVFLSASPSRDKHLFPQISTTIQEALDEHLLPGAVVVFGHQGSIVYRKAFGNRSILPTITPMTIDTMFDMASLTKVVATATAIMMLVEQKRINLNAPVASYIPTFGCNGKEHITVKQLLLHISGFIPDNALADYENGMDQAFSKIYALAPRTTPGTAFVYSDINYLVLGKLVELITHQTLADFTYDHIYQPLGMTTTMFIPTPQFTDRCAPTELRGKTWIQGTVHDPRSYLLGGIAGHAGLFSTADDVAIFCHMILNGGIYNGTRILQSNTIKQMLEPQVLPDGNIRSLGWDIQTKFSSIKGDYFGRSTVAHTGFTGTSILIDPPSQTFIIILSSRLHPDGKGSVIELRRKISDIVARSLNDVRSSGGN